MLRDVNGNLDIRQFIVEEPKSKRNESRFDPKIDIGRLSFDYPASLVMGVKPKSFVSSSISEDFRRFFWAHILAPEHLPNMILANRQWQEEKLVEDINLSKNHPDMGVHMMGLKMMLWPKSPVGLELDASLRRKTKSEVEQLLDFRRDLPVNPAEIFAQNVLLGYRLLKSWGYEDLEFSNDVITNTVNRFDEFDLDKSRGDYLEAKSIMRLVFPDRLELHKLPDGYLEESVSLYRATDKRLILPDLELWAKGLGALKILSADEVSIGRSGVELKFFQDEPIFGEKPMPLRRAY